MLKTLLSQGLVLCHTDPRLREAFKMFKSLNQHYTGNRIWRDRQTCTQTDTAYYSLGYIYLCVVILLFISNTPTLSFITSRNLSCNNQYFTGQVYRISLRISSWRMIRTWCWAESKVTPAPSFAGRSAATRTQSGTEWPVFFPEVSINLRLARKRN